MDQQRPVPCNYCREKHLKCDNDSPCAHCSKQKHECIRSRKRIRFSKSARSNQNLDFATDQPWVETRNTGRLAYIDVTAHITQGKRTALDGPERVVDVEAGLNDAEHVHGHNTIGSHSSDDDEAGNVSEPANTYSLDLAQTAAPPTYDSLIEEDSHTTLVSMADNDNQTYTQSTMPAQSHVSPTARSDSAVHTNRPPPTPWRESSTSFRSPGCYSTGAISRPNDSVTPLSAALSLRVQSTALRGLPEGYSDEAYLELREACLFRHFVKNLAPWFDITDRDRHYAIVVPQRALFCPVLLYAIYTASARHLTRLWNKQNPGTTVKFDGVDLTGLDDQTAIQYHNVCINYLIEVSNDPTQSYNEDTLTAATILRFYEQIDTPLTGQDSETYLNVVRAVVETQEDETFYSIRKIHGPIRDVDPYVSPAVSLRHSACLMALRQEIWSVLLYRRSIQLPINPNNDFELIDNPPPADDFVWANRILVWTADVLKFCFGGVEMRTREHSNNPSPSLNVDSKSRVERWSALKRFETTWQLQQPASFKPVYQRPITADDIFPQIWLNSDVQVLALQHFEIASLMLAVYDPRLPRLGLDAISAHRNLASRIRKATLKLCGMALSNKGCPPAMVDAAVAISMCGAYFEDSKREEQDAIIRFLEALEAEHAWPTNSVVVALREAWFEGGSAGLRTLPVVI